MRSEHTLGVKKYKDHHLSILSNHQLNNFHQQTPQLQLFTMKAVLATLAIFLGTALAAPTATAFPKPASSTGLPTAKLIPAGTVFDGKMVRYSRSPDTCQDQTETDEAAAMFIAEDGATIKNVILSKEQAEGIHCRGACTLENVWWEDVCEDAATFKQPAGKTSYVIGKPPHSLHSRGGTQNPEITANDT